MNKAQSMPQSGVGRPQTQQVGHRKPATDYNMNVARTANNNKFETTKIQHEPVPMNERERVKDAPCGLKNVGNSKYYISHVYD